MSKKKIGSLIFVFVLLAGYLLLEQSKKTTYQEIISQQIGKNEIIKEVEIIVNEPLMKKTATTKIEDKKTIRQLLETNFKIKKGSKHSRNLVFINYINVRTDKGLYQIEFADDYVVIAGETYYTVDPKYNPIYKYISENEFDWEITPYKTYSK